MAKQRRENVFISYSHHDKAWLKRLRTMLVPLERSGKLVVWDDTMIPTGAKWRANIQQALDSCKVAVLLVTDNFLASDFVVNVELASFLKASKKDGLLFFLILISDCLYDQTELKDFQFANDVSTPVDTLPRAKQKQVLADISRDLITLLEQNLPSKDKLPVIQGTRRTDILRLPITEYALFGREKELTILSRAWNNPDINLLIVQSFGGTGKTALVNHWLQNLKQDDWGGADYIFGWSFFNQGSLETGQTSSELFISEALKFVGAEDPGPISAWEKGRYLAESIRSKRILLILDGAETLQEPPGTRGGYLRDQGLLSLLLELSNENKGLCLLTTRIEIEDVKGINPNSLLYLRLEKLTPRDGALLLKHLGVNGSEEEFYLASEEFDGHPLALRLLGNYLVEVYDGNIHKRDQIKHLTDEENQGYHARRVMSSYEQWFIDKPELQILYLMGLFDRPAESEALDILRKDATIFSRENPLHDLDVMKWKYALGRLCKTGLINEDDKQYDCHPLVREHFAKRFKEMQPGLWIACHGILYDYYRNKPAMVLPATLEELDPLFQAVFHACQAGRHAEGFKIYWERINRGNEVYCTHKLGAVAADLGVIRNFFAFPWTKLMEDFEEKDQAWLYNQAGYDLRSIGKLDDSREPIEAGLKLCVEVKEWRSAARCANNLSRIHLMLGEVTHSLNYAHAAVKYADFSNDRFCKIAYRSNLAHALHQAGNYKDAGDLYVDIEKNLEEQPLPLNNEIRSNQYWDFQLSQLHYQEVLLSAEQSLQKQDGRLLNIALDYLSLGRALMMKLEQEGKGYSINEKENLQTQILEKLNQSVKLLLQAGRQHEIPRGFLARATFYRQINDFEKAQSDIDQAFKVAERYSMKLHLIDCYLEYMKLLITENNYSTAFSQLKTALSLINQTGYHRSNNELTGITNFFRAEGYILD